MAAAFATFAQSGWRRIEVGAAVVAEFYRLSVLRTAGGAYFQCHGSTAVVAELAVSCRFAARRADGGFAFDFTIPYCGGSSFFIDVAFHCFGSCLGYINFLSRRTCRAESFIFVPAMVANILVTRRTAMEMAHGFIFRHFKSAFVFFLPFGGAPLKFLAQNVYGAVGTIANATGFAAQQTAEGAGAATDAVE